MHASLVVVAGGVQAFLHGGCDAVDANGTPPPRFRGLADHYELDLDRAEWMVVESHGQL